MQDKIDDILSILEEISTDEVEEILALLVAGFLEAVTENKLEAMYYLSTFNADVAEIIMDEDEVTIH